jgi:hypothetical protein
MAFSPTRVIVSDDAGQFDIGLHASCWIHTEYLVHKLDAFIDEHRAAHSDVRELIWNSGPSQPDASHFPGWDAFQRTTRSVGSRSLLHRFGNRREHRRREDGSKGTWLPRLQTYGLVHQWGNPGNQPLTFVTCNINHEGAAAVLRGIPTRAQ